MRTKAAGFAMLALLGLVAAACGGSSAPAASVTRSGTITIWHQYAGTELDSRKALYDAYTRLYPNVTINLVNKPNLVDAVNVTTAAGPDIVASVDDQIGRWVKIKVLQPVNSYVDSGYVSSQYAKVAVDAATFGGKLYGLPETVETITLLYNKKLVNATDVPTTTDALVRFAKNYANSRPGEFGVVWNTTDAYFQAPWIYGSGGFYVKADGTVGLNTAGTKAGFNFVASFKGSMPAQVDGAVADTLFKEGKAAMIVAGPSSLAGYTKAGVAFGFATLPVVLPGTRPASPFVSVKTLMLGAHSANPALAVDVMKFVTNRANQTQMVLATGEVPANKLALGDSKVQAIPTIAGFGAQVKNGVALPNTPFIAALWDPVSKALAAVWTGKQSVDSALVDAQAAAEKNVAALK
jgi:arabinogalactan oligomer/maltooligosaccharide transport system substrate-binding protein